ncbi:CLUMA_CG020144, isoform A [Clunio marinus]|uniref:CLUMA_CG020144, isoform A n=1 Tax=Clunio marinus TaxID=568069 RepID=A0A1J1J421_9DIPT|nr:CLUMA_CG020144, isoform A [Clunio marinus]
MRNELIDRFERDGYVVLEDFYSSEEVAEMLTAGRNLCFEAPKEERKVFSTTSPESSQNRDKYFIESGDKIRYFFESGAVGKNNEILVPEAFALNKVGHALASLHPIFRKYTFDNRIREICWQLGFQRPAVAQSMYIYKNPGVGSEVVSHQDGTFLFTEPASTVGFWIALEDATLENGCLKFIRSSHKTDIHRRYIRNADKSSKEILIYDRPAPVYQLSSFTAVPVKKGTLIAIHSQVVHRSENNKSKASRQVYTFHMIETRHTKYSDENWLQTSEPFPILYER